MLFQSTIRLEPREGMADRRLALLQTKKMLPEYVFDALSLADNPLTLEEVQAVMDGLTIHGRKSTDVRQVLAMRDAWQLIIDHVEQRTFQVKKALLHDVHALVARSEAITWGEFRKKNKDAYAPPADKIENDFDREIPQIMKEAENAAAAAIRLYTWMMMNQPYDLANARVARLVASGILLDAGIGTFDIRASDILVYNWKLFDFYQTLQADELMAFLLERCVCYML